LLRRPRLLCYGWRLEAIAMRACQPPVDVLRFSASKVTIGAERQLFFVPFFGY
jgi:hypothetical protein